jgi:hypothetical protein
MAFKDNVFVNCPFDPPFFALLRPLLFTVLSSGLTPRIALEAMDSAQLRMDKILRLIGRSKFAIHDISRIESKDVGELFRLNMPFELGLDLGARYFGSASLRKKKCLVLEEKEYRYKAALSDFSGFDIACHGNEPAQVVVVVRNWLRNECGANPRGATAIWGSFTGCMADLYVRLTDEGHSPKDIEELPIPELIDHMKRWISTRGVSHRIAAASHT